MTTNLDGHVVKFPGHEFSFKLLAGELDDTGIITALDAVDMLREDWEPLAVEAVVTGTEGDDEVEVRPGKPHWLLSRAAIPPGVVVESVMIDPIRTEGENLSRSRLEAWLGGALADCAREKPGRRAEWRTLRFRACRARLGPPNWRGERAELRLRTDAGVLVVPLERDERGTWVSGPRQPAFDQPPLAVIIGQRWSLLRLDIVANYGFWLDAAEPAAGQLAAAMARLAGLGWERE